MSDDWQTVRDRLPTENGVTAQALDRLESQNQALQEENERLHKAYGRLVERLRLVTPRSLMEVSDEALSPTQETDPE